MRNDELDKVGYHCGDRCYMDGGKCSSALREVDVYFADDLRQYDHRLICDREIERIRRTGEFIVQ